MEWSVKYREREREGQAVGESASNALVILNLIYDPGSAWAIGEGDRLLTSNLTLYNSAQFLFNFRSVSVQSNRIE